MYNDTTTSYKYINTTTDATPFYIVGEAIEPFTSFVYDNFNLSTAQYFIALAYNGTYFWIGGGDGYVYRYTESGYDNWSFFVGGNIYGLDFNGTYFFVYNSTRPVYRYTADGVYDTTLFTPPDDAAYYELDWYDNKIYMIGVNSKKIWIYYENGTKYNNITISAVSGVGVATQNGIYLYVYDAGTSSTPDKRILVYKDLGYMNGGTYIGEWDISSDIGSGSASGIKVVSNRLYVGTNPNPTRNPNRIKRYAHISNPSSIGTLNDGQSYLLNYTINVTDSPTKDYRLIFNFTSSLAPNPAENDTQPAYIRIISAVDTIPPTYSLNSTNSTLAGTAVSHNLYWQDNIGLSYAIFSFDNCTGIFQNISGISLSGTSAWSNFTVVINSTVGCTIRWKVYANDTSNNWNASQEYSYITTSPVYISISLSPTLAGGITFGNLDPNSINVSSINCNNQQCNITVSSDTTVNVDIVVKINSYLTRQGGTETISTQYWNSSTTQQPVSPAYQFSTSYDYNHKVANNVPPNTNVIFNSWLTILGGQAPGVYNNTIYFCACEAGTTNC
jgi:hypothetical protein